MRTIKYRGKTKTWQWVYGLPTYDQNGEITIIMVRDPLKTLMCYVVDPETIGKFTGLKGKNGKEIYDGDLVRWANITHEIRFHGEYGWMMKDDREDWDCPSLYAQELVDRKGYARVEVVGNIYDSPVQAGKL